MKDSWKHIFSKKDSSDKNKSGFLPLQDRLGAYRYLPKFLNLIWNTSPWLTFLGVFLRISQSVLPVGVLYTGKLIIDQVVNIIRDPNVSHSYLWELVGIEFVLIILITTCGKISMLVEELLGDLLTSRTSIMLISHAAKIDLDQFEDSFFYDKLDRARQQTVGRAQLLSQILSQLQDILTLGIMATGLVVYEPWLILVLFIAVIPSFFGEAYFNSKNYNLIRRQTQGRRELDYLTSIGTGGMAAKEVRLFDLSQFLITRFRNLFTAFYRDRKSFGIRRTGLSILLGVPGSVGYYIVFIYIIREVISGEITIGALTLLLSAIRQLGMLFQNVARRFNAVAKEAIYLQDFFDFFEIMPKIKVPLNPRPFPNPIKLGFTFENVGFKYLNSERWANRNLNFTLRPGEKLALVGENGAGKTTLVKLLVRLYDPTEGQILLDGYNLQEYDLTELRREMGIIFQDFLRYQMTMSDNIAVGNISQKDNEKLIVDAAKRSLADAIVQKLPHQYNQMLGKHFNDGVELSGGEWQKVALARAYMRNAKIMILDEPTAALDARSEYEVFQRFSEATKDKTAVLISHRFSTVRMADRILVLDKGEILEIGSHEELLTQQGRYAELFQLQASGYK
jgi:ATP-binding cassette subfamily B protein